MLPDRREEHLQLLARFNREVIRWLSVGIGTLYICAAFKSVGILIGYQDMVTNPVYIEMVVAVIAALVIAFYVFCPVSVWRRLDRLVIYQNFATAYNSYIVEPNERHAYVAYMAWRGGVDIPFTRQELRDKFTRDGMPSFVRYANGEVVTWID